MFRNSLRKKMRLNLIPKLRNGFKFKQGLRRCKSNNKNRRYFAGPMEMAQSNIDVDRLSIFNNNTPNMRCKEHRLKFLKINHIMMYEFDRFHFRYFGQTFNRLCSVCVCTCSASQTTKRICKTDLEIPFIQSIIVNSLFVLANELVSSSV